MANNSNDDPKRPLPPLNFPAVDPLTGAEDRTGQWRNADIHKPTLVLVVLAIAIVVLVTLWLLVEVVQ